MKWEVVSSLSSSVIALTALVFTIFSFKKQQDRADKYEKAVVKPILSIKSQTYKHLKSIRLINYGVGPAIITKVEFRRSLESQPTNNIVTLFELDIVWETFVNVLSGRALPAEKEIVLVKQSLRHLEEQGISKEKGLSILREWKNQKTGILVFIEYEDIYGNKLKPLEDTLK